MNNEKRIVSVELKEGIKNAQKIRDKELIRAYYGLYINKEGKIQNFIDARFFMGRSSQSSVVYCLLWIHGDTQWGSGKGQAGGYGYDKTSAAFSEALDSAGIKNYGINSAGETAIKQAIQEIADNFGFTSVFIQEAYS